MVATSSVVVFCRGVGMVYEEAAVGSAEQRTKQRAAVQSERRGREGI
jgi:hypothetical protein